MKEAVSKVSAIQLCYLEEVDYIEVVHLKGDKYFFGLKEYDDDLFKYKNALNLHSLDDVAGFIGKGCMLDKDRRVWILPQVRIYTQNGFHDGYLTTNTFTTNEEAEEEYNRLVKEYHLSEVTESDLSIN